MRNLSEVYRPQTIQDALKLLQDSATVALAGGSQLIAEPRRGIRAVVDLSDLGLSYLREENGTIAVGATTTLAELSDSPILRALANGIVAEAAHQTTASILRNQGTVAGTLVAEPDGPLALVLLALDTKIVVVTLTGEAALSLQEPGGEGFLSQRSEILRRGALIRQVTIPLTNVKASLQTVGRTPNDRPIVAAVAAAQIENGIARGVRVALSGESETVIRATPAERELEGQALTPESVERAAAAASQGLSPKGDYLGSIDYRKGMAVVLTRRALQALAA